MSTPHSLTDLAVEDADQASPRITELVREIIVELGEDPARDGLLRTPQRVAGAFEDLTSGYRMKVDDVLNGALFDVSYDEMVIVKDIEMFSLCEHHLLPFFGKVHVAYIPSNKVIGLSKMARLVDMFSRRFQVQERLTSPDRQHDSGGDPTARRGCGLRSASLVHDDARRRETALVGDHQHDARGVSREYEDSRRVSLAGEPPLDWNLAGETNPRFGESIG